MKSLLVINSKTYIFVFFLLTITYKPSKACHVASLTIDSIKTTGANHSVYLKLCVGYGKTGTTLGAGGPTTDFVFTMWSNSAVTVTGFPANITGNSPANAVFEGVLAGPGFGLGEKENLYYYDPNFNGAEYTCVSSTAACGNVGTFCKQFRLDFSGILPDSIRAMGIEGGGNIFGGCFPDNDMKIFPAIYSTLPIEMIYFKSKAEKKHNILEWSTASETNNDRFEIQKSQDAVNWAILGNVKGAVNSSYTLKYVYTDNQIEEGYNYYRLKQIDLDGRFTYSSISAVDNSQKNDQEVIRTIDLYGRDVDKTYEGILIEIYSDGTSRMRYSTQN